MAKVTNMLRPYDSCALKMKGAGSHVTLTFALLETVRMVLEEGQDTEDEEKHALSAGHDDFNTSSGHTSSDSYLPLPRSRRPAANKLSGILGGPCAHCGATESPQWRRPLTKKVVLCNACGIYYSRHHSLPKRKKISAPKHSAFDDSGAEQDPDSDVGMQPAVLKMEPMLASPKKAQRSPSPTVLALALPTDSTSSAECVQHETLKPAPTPKVCTPTNSSGSPAHCSSFTAAGSRGKRRVDALQLAPDAADQSPAKRAVKRAAALAAPLQAMPSTPGGSPKAGSPEVSDADAAGRRPVITTAVASILTPVKAAANGEAHTPLPVDMPFPLVTVPRPEAATGLPTAKGALSEQSADSDIGMILIPMSTCRGPRQSISLKTAQFWP